MNFDLLNTHILSKIDKAVEAYKLVNCDDELFIERCMMLKIEESVAKSWLNIIKMRMVHKSDLTTKPQDHA